MVTSFGQRLSSAFRDNGQLCVGLDPSSTQLFKWGLPVSASGAEDFCNLMMDSCDGLVGILKPQVSFFEQFGSSGFSALERLLVRAKDKGYLVIADAKRGDIGSTMDGYTRAWLSETSPFTCDAVTVSPYLGPDSLEETVRVAAENGKGLFLLAATSNPEAKILQSSTGPDQQSVAARVTTYAASKNDGELDSVGVVIGAQTHLEDFGIDAGNLKSTPILAPGFGSQGALLSDARKIFGETSTSVIFSVSRSIAGDSASGLQDRVLSAVRELEKGLEI